MKRLLTNLFTLSVCILASATAMAQPRQVQSLDFGWRFQAGDVKDAALLTTDDSNWRSVNLPHDFQIEQPWVAPAADEKADNSDAAANIKSRLSSRGFKEMGIGWYRLHLTLPDSLRSRRLLIDFGGIMYTGDVYLNGERVGGTDYGYLGFAVDVTGKVKFGRDENILAVRADTRDPKASRWYTGGGLFRSVRLIATSKDVYLERHPLRISTRANRFVTITVEATTQGKDKQMPVSVSILDPQGLEVYQGEAVVKRATPSRTVEQQLPEIEIANPQLWDTDHPNLYTAVVTLKRQDGSVADCYQEHFGLRTVEFAPAFGMKLNGRKVLLKGYANHHSLGALGAAAYPRAIEKRLQLMKQFGINHIRTSHNPYSREFIELCDKYGILVVDELYDKWTRQHTGGRVPFEQLWQADVQEWVKRDRNSPSVVMWSLGNELQQDPNMPYNDYGVTLYRLMRPLVSRFDSTRLVTVAMHPRYRNWETDSLPCELAKITDVQAYNYRYMYFPGDGRRFPWMTFYQSEASISAMGPNYFEMNLDKVIGLAYWGAIDYLGESQGWPAKGWSQGVFTIDLEPKPKAYLMKSMFKPDEPVVHIGIIDKKGDQMWNGVQTGNDGMSDHWQRVEGQKLSLYTYTNADEVELVLNGKSLGTKPNPVGDAKHRNQILWTDVVYQPGYLEAIARTGGKVVARHRIETTGPAIRLKAEADVAGQWAADGYDLMHVRIAAVDKKGRLVQTATGEVTFDVQGNAEIVGVINGDINSPELTVGSKRSLWNGTCTVILRSTRQAGAVILTATVPGLKPVKLPLLTR
ncbi:MAG: DUF4982 domain-containing protein [Prevotella sp.]|nr:DUF4982 domain-containing protein [Prevotella sp.]